MTETIPLAEINRNALISFLTAVVALLALCAGFLPIPFTAILCYPPGLVLGILSLVYGFTALKEIRLEQKRGRRLAMLAIGVGSFMVFATICLTTAGILLWPRVSEFLQQAVSQSQP
jgi:hypothetical protein